MELFIDSLFHLFTFLVLLGNYNSSGCLGQIDPTMDSLSLLEENKLDVKKSEWHDVVYL